MQEDVELWSLTQGKSLGQSSAQCSRAGTGLHLAVPLAPLAALQGMQREQSCAITHALI